MNGSRAALGVALEEDAGPVAVVRADVAVESSAGEVPVPAAAEEEPAKSGVRVPDSRAAAVELMGAGASGVTAEAPIGVSGAEMEASVGATDPIEEESVDSGATEPMAVGWGEVEGKGTGGF